MRHTNKGSRESAAVSTADTKIKDCDLCRLGQYDKTQCEMIETYLSEIIHTVASIPLISLLWAMLQLNEQDSIIRMWYLGVFASV